MRTPRTTRKIAALGLLFSSVLPITHAQAEHNDIASSSRSHSLTENGSTRTTGTFAGPEMDGAPLKAAATLGTLGEIRSAADANTRVEEPSIDAPTLRWEHLVGGGESENTADTATDTATATATDTATDTATEMISVADRALQIANEAVWDQAVEEAKVAHDKLVLAAIFVATKMKSPGLTEMLINVWEQTSAARMNVVYAGLAGVGKPYVTGGIGPNSYDCSGLTLTAWQTNGKTFPHWAATQEQMTKKVKAKDLVPGDLVFKHDDGRTGHVKLYLGAGVVVHASGHVDGRRVTGVVFGTLAVGDKAERYGHVNGF